MVVLSIAPPGLLEGLPAEDRGAVLQAIGRPIRFAGYDEDGRAELEFTDASGVVHLIYVNPSVIRPA